jgi:penicillin-insensitive murein endopeptidase
MRALLRPGIAVLAVVLAATALPPRPASASTDDNPWARATRPSKGASRAVGTTSGGCLAGSVALPARGKGFRVMRPERRRHFGHPALARLIRELGKKLVRTGLGSLPIGDLSQPRGGPAPDGHSSHQTGLDVDIWFAVARRRGPPQAVPMVDAAKGAPTRAWSKRQARILELAARDPRVDRIFINPVLKADLCKRTRGDRAWLTRIRPWWGHDQHFHLRLACPADSPDCTPQKALPPGDGCAELAWWLSPVREKERADQRQAYRGRIGTKPPLPAPCAAIVPPARPSPKATTAATTR